MIRALLRSALAGLCLIVLVSCGGKKSAPASIVGHNHTADGVTFSVDGYGSIYQGPHSGGGGSTCCIGVPREWRPGLQVKVEWLVGVDEAIQRRVVDLPRYDRPGHLSVHFLRSGQIKVFVTPYQLWHPDYPLKGEEARKKPGESVRGPL